MNGKQQRYRRKLSNRFGYQYSKSPNSYPLPYRLRWSYILLLAAGFKGPIYATTATAALLPLVIEDALKVGVTRNKSIIKACIKLLNNQLVPLEYKQW